MTLSFKGVGAITLFVEDLPRARAFYRDVFGLKLLFEDGCSAAFGFGDTIINLLAVAEARDLVAPGTVAGPGAGSRFQLTIWVEDADGVCAELAARGVTLLNGPMDRDWGKRTAAIADPAGNIWEIAQDIPTKTA